MSHVHPNFSIWFDALRFWAVLSPWKAYKSWALQALQDLKSVRRYFYHGTDNKIYQIKRGNQYILPGAKLKLLSLWLTGVNLHSFRQCIFPSQPSMQIVWMKMKKHRSASDKPEPSCWLNFQAFILKLFFSCKLTVRLSLGWSPQTPQTAFDV